MPLRSWRRTRALGVSVWSAPNGRARMDRHHVSLAAALLLAAVWGASGCRAGRPDDPPAAAPPAPVVQHESDGNVIHVDHPERLALVTAVAREITPTLTVTGVVSPDVSQTVPVVSLASGRVVDLRVQLGDHVSRGQLLLRVQSADVSGAMADYRKATADAALARAQLARAQDLYGHGGIAKKDLEVAQDAADKAGVDLDTTAERLRLLGVEPSSASAAAGIVDVVAPVSGVITEQNVTTAAGVKTLDNSPNLFTISDLSRVWIVCDVNENDLSRVHLGDRAEVHVDAYPTRVLKGGVGNISPILDPTLRTAKVRIELPNPDGLLRIGMFVNATFESRASQIRTVVPAAAVLHLHDRDWVYVAGDDGLVRRCPVVVGAMLPGNSQEIVSGLEPHQRVVANALMLQMASES